MTDNYELSLAVFDSGEARDKLRGATAIILALEKDYEDAVRNAAESEAAYRVTLAEKFKAHRDGGMAVEAANTLARGEVVMLSKERDHAAGMLKLAGEKLDNARDTRRSLWRLVEWARQIDAAKGKALDDERIPAATWPTA